MTATIIPFGRPPEPPAAFGPQEMAEMHRWAPLAVALGWLLHFGDDGRGGQGWVAHCDDGSPYVTAERCGPDGEPLLNQPPGWVHMVMPEGSQWSLMDDLGLPLARFGTLRGALEAICPTDGAGRRAG